MICNKIAKSYDDKISEVSKNLKQNNSETDINDHDKKIPKERYKSPGERQKPVDDMRLIQPYNNGISENNEFFRPRTKSAI